MISRPQQTLVTVLGEIFPSRRIVQEKSLGPYRLDVYIPSLRLALEFDGKQHSEFIPFFHRSMLNFLHGSESDFEKERLCKKKNIILIRISDEKKLTKENISKLIEDQETQIIQAIKEHQNEQTDENVFESQKRLRRDIWKGARREAYHRVKDKLKEDRRRLREHRLAQEKARLAEKGEN